MENIYHIRYEFNEKGKSLRQIAKETGHDRQTVKKFVEQDDFNTPDPVRRSRKCKADRYRDQVRQWLIDDRKAPRKKRHTARRIYDRLKQIEEQEGRKIDISERSIRTLVSRLKLELGQSSMAALPLLHPAGEARSILEKRNSLSGVYAIRAIILP